MNDRSGREVVRKKESKGLRGQHIAFAQLAGATLLLLANTVGRAAPRPSPEWIAQMKTGVVCTDNQLHSVEHNIKCSDGVEKAMRLAAAQLPPLPKGVVIDAEILGVDPDDVYDYLLLVSVSDRTGVREHSVGYSVPIHCTITHEEECGRSAIYRGYLTWEMGSTVAERMDKKMP